MKIQDKKPLLIIALFLGYLIPGLGHWYVGKKIKASVFLIAIMPCYVLGLNLAGGVFWSEINILAILGFIVNFFNGLPFIMSSFNLFALDNTSQYYEIGKTFMLVSGALNMLVLVYLFDEFKKEDKD